MEGFHGYLAVESDARWRCRRGAARETDVIARNGRPSRQAGPAAQGSSRGVEPKVYGRIGNLEVRLARTRSEVRSAQRLRYQVFYEEMSAEPSRLAQFRRRDEDAFDPVCDHLLVVDLDKPEPRWRGARKAPPKVVGTYRVLRQDIAERHLGFYTEREYDIAPLVAARSPQYRFVELGRSCVLAPYRGKRSVELLVARALDLRARAQD